jgi:VWFA-related protein
MMRIAAVIVLTALTIPPGSAQVSEQVSVELVEVPVYVRSVEGRPVQGLSRDAFELYVNGRRQEIEYFDAINFSARATPSAPAPSVRSSRQRRLYLLLFDLHYSIPGHLARARDAARKVVARSNPDTDLFAVASYSTNKGVQFITAFTSDHVVITRAIETLALSRQHDPLGIAISTAERVDWAPPTDDDNGFSSGRRGDEADAAMAQAIAGGTANQEIQKEPEKKLTEAILINFADLAGRLANLEGQKHVLYLSEGFKVFDSKMDPRHPKLLSDMGRAFHQAGVFLDAIDIAGLRPSFTNAGNFLSPTNWNLQLLTDAAGGEFVHNRNDLNQAIGSVLERQEALYILAFHRRNTRGGTINVRVRGVPRGTHLSFREQFGDVGPKRLVDPLELADILINSTPQHGATVLLSLRQQELMIKTPSAEIVPQLTSAAPFVDVLVYVFDEKGSVVLENQKRITIDTKQTADSLNIRVPLDLPPAAYVAKCLLRIGNGSALGFSEMKFRLDPRNP